MISLKQMTQLAASSTEVWRILQLDLSKNWVVEPGELKNNPERPAVQLQRDRKLLWDLTFRLKITLEDEGANSALKARMLVDGARKLETLDLKMLPAREDKNRHAQLVKDYQIGFDALCLVLAEDGTEALIETFNYPEHGIALAEFGQLRREQTGLESRGAVLEKIIAEALEEWTESEHDSACAEAFLGRRNAQGGIVIASSLLLAAIFFFRIFQSFTIGVGSLGLILLLVGLYFRRSHSVVFNAFEAGLKLKVSRLDPSGFRAMRERLITAQENLKVLKLRMDVISDELKNINAKLVKVVALERTWPGMTDSEIDKSVQAMTQRCQQFFGESGARLILQNKLEIALL